MFPAKPSEADIIVSIRIMKEEHLEYFKSLLEGRANVSWHGWFGPNEAALQEELPRADFLRLKFHNVDAARDALVAAGIEFTESPLAKREKYYATLSKTVLDSAGRPRPEFKRKAYGDAMGYFMDGDIETGVDHLAKFLKTLRRRPIDVRREELEGLCFDAEMELEYGNPKTARAMLQLVADFPSNGDLLDGAIDRANKLLEKC